jgi:hypothetical protein
MDNLVGTEPAVVLTHGPTKILVDKYIWHSPDAGIVASYMPKERDVKDHFGIFRGVDQIEAFAQATIVSCGAFTESRKLKCSFAELKEIFIPVFIGIGPVKFHSYLETGDTFVSVGQIVTYKFRQMVCNGRIYKAPKGLDLDAYFSDFNEDRLTVYDLSKDFILVAELQDVTGRALKKELLK